MSRTVSGGFSSFGLEANSQTDNFKNRYNRSPSRSLLHSLDRAIARSRRHSTTRLLDRTAARSRWLDYWVARSLDRAFAKLIGRLVAQALDDFVASPFDRPSRSRGASLSRRR